MSVDAPPATTPARPGCGCGACGSGSGAAPADLAATAFVRPRFFAGQLLTEDDLGLLTTYTTAKDRLHNRYLFGAGVVCGLWVSCDPCGGGTVTVQPGYALDCCGNDLLLACPTTLDINAMIRDLRAAQLGKDCGDPCAGQGTQSAGRKETPITRRYCLYARYGEQDTDPVAPYATEEPCGQVACEPTRIREGTGFVLRCPEDALPPADLWSRLRACLPAKETLRHAGRLGAYSGPMIAAAAAAEHPPIFHQADADELEKLRAGLAKGRQAVGEDQIESATEQVRELAAILAKYDLAKDRPQLAGVTEARNELRDAAAALTGSVTATWDDPLDRAAVGALLAHAARLADRAATWPVPQLAMLAQGRPLDDSVLAVLTSDAAALEEWLLARLDSDPALGDCELRSLVQAVSAATPTTGEAQAVRSLGRAGSELVELLIRFVTDCVCAALNPPCTSCEDTDVLLACVEVRDCEVVRICNAERDYVVSGSALRYWLPVGLLHQRIESLCCPAKPRRDAIKEPAGLAFQKAGFGIGDPTAPVPWELLSLPQPADVLRDAFHRAGVELSAPATPSPSPAPSSPAQPAADKAAADATAQQVTTLTERVTELTDQLDQTRARLDELARQSVASPSPASPSPASPSPASPSRASASRASASRGGPGRRTAAKKPADAGQSTAGTRGRGRRTGSAKASPAAGQSPEGTGGRADDGHPPADPGTVTGGPDSPEASDGT